MAKREEISNVIVFLCSDKSSYMTGSNILVVGYGRQSKKINLIYYENIKNWK